MTDSPDENTSSNLATRWVGRSHGRWVHSRRVQVLANAVTPSLKAGWHVFDVGCGDGQLGRLLQEQASVSVQGFERHARPETAIPIQEFDGAKLPAADSSADAVLFVDVLHHTEDPMVLLREAARVARRSVIIKDHRMARPLSHATLRFMDWVGNRPHGVELPYNYWPEDRWRAAWKSLGWTVERFETKLGLYPRPASWLFESGLHFVAQLNPESRS